MPSLTLRKFWDETKCTFLGMAAQCTSTKLTDGAQDECGVQLLLVYQARPISLAHWKLCREMLLPTQLPMSERNGSSLID